MNKLIVYPEKVSPLPKYFQNESVWVQFALEIKKEMCS